MARESHIRELVQKVRRIHIRSKKRVAESMAGRFQSAFKGAGIEFFEVRGYLPGDDVGSIDWNVTARTGNLHVKSYVEEREQRVILLVDASASTAFGSGRVRKSETAAELCALLGLSAMAGSDQVGLILFSDRVERHLPPRKGVEHGMRLVREVLAFQPKGRGTDLDAALLYLNRVHRKRAIVFLISDFLDEGRYGTNLGLAGQRHDLIGVRVVDPGERDLPPGGIYRLADLETGRELEVDTGHPGLCHEFHVRALEHGQAVNRRFARRGLDLLEVEAGADCAPVIEAFLKSRMLRRAP